jgi:flagellar biosynthetic protein FliP
MTRRRALAGLALLLASGLALAQDIPLVNAAPAAGGGTSYSVPVQTVLLLTAMSFLPSALMLMTSFTRILIVFSLLRQALGLQSMPPNSVLVALSLFLTLFVMNPVFEAMYNQGWKPYAQKTIGLEEALDKGIQPLRAFMVAHTRDSDLQLFSRLSKLPLTDRESAPLRVVVPAFAISEIRTGFLVGFMIFLPFVVIDLAVASILTSVGMVMVSPVMFSLPVKLIIFTLADGWSLLAGSLVESFLTR